MGYQTFRPITKTRQSNKQKHAKVILQAAIMNFSQIKTLAKPLCTPRSQLQEHNFTQQIPQPVPRPVIFNEN